MGLGLKKRRKRRQDRKAARKDARHQRRLDKMGVRTDRALNRQANRAEAYAAGIDPNAWVGDVADFAGTAAMSMAGASAAESFAGAMGKSNSVLDPAQVLDGMGGTARQEAGGDPPSGDGKGILPLVAVGAALYLATK